MTHSPLVSVVLIFLNAGNFIEEAIASVLAQTYPHWELLLVDDGSRDASTDIALRHASRYPDRIRYLEHPGRRNRGISATRNLGIAHSRGEYIAFLDADDVFLPHKLSDQVALLRAHADAGMVYGTYQLWYGWTQCPADVARDQMSMDDVPSNTLVHPPTLLTLDLQEGRWVAHTSAMLVRRDVIDRVGGFEEQFRGMFDDRVFQAKVYLTAPVLVTDRPCSRYRQHPDSCVATSKRTGQRNAAELVYLQWLERYLRRVGVDDLELWSILRSRLRKCRHRTALDRRRRAIRSIASSARYTMPDIVYRGFRRIWHGLTGIR